MIIDFSRKEKTIIHNFNGGNGDTVAGMYMDDAGKILQCTLAPGDSIGKHRHTTNYEVEFVLQGRAKFMCDGKTEILEKGMCHYCRNGSEHSVENVGEENLVLYCVVPNCK